MSMLQRTNKLEDSKLWHDATLLAEKAFDDAADIPEENKNWNIIYKMRQKAFDLTSAIAEAEGSNNPRDIEWSYGQARASLFSLKNTYHLARKTELLKVDTEEMIQLDKLIKEVDKELVNCHKSVANLEKEEMKRRAK